MNIIKYALFIAALSLPVTNTHALEWVDYDGTIPDNAVMVNEGVEDRPICRNNARIGVVNDSGKCRSVKIGSGISKKDDFQILVDTYNVYEAVQADEDMYTQTDLDDAVTEATEDMFTQAEYDAVVADNATLQEQNAALEEEVASFTASSSSTDDVWSYESQREAILSVGEVKSWKNKLYSENMDHDMRNFHLEYLDEDSTPITMYDIAIANTKVNTPAMSYPVGSCNGWGTSTWVEHLAAEGVHPQLAVLIARFGNRYYARGTVENSCD